MPVTGRPRGGNQRDPFGYINLKKRIIHAVAQGTVGGVGRVLIALAAAIEDEVGDGSEMRRVNQGIADEMRSAVLDAYHLTVKEGGSGPRSYQRLSGTLLKAIDQDANFLGTEDGIQFVNAAVLSKEAAHWKRLNFGAGERAGPPYRKHTLRYAGFYVAPLGFSIGPQAPFTLPRGIFVDPEGRRPPMKEYRGQSTGRVFHLTPGRRSKFGPQETSGIVGRHFLEAGLDVLEQEFGPRYEQMFNKWIRNSKKKAQAAARVGYGAPVRVRFSNPYYRGR